MITRRLPALAASLLAAILIVLPARSQTGAAGDRILQQELKQQQLQRATHRLGEQLNSIIGEFERNGLAGEDLRTLKSIRTVLGRLGEKDMIQVISLLQQARSTPDENASRQGLAGAYAGQKTILTLLKQLILEYERQQALYELSIRFREMAARQGRNMRAGVWLARTADRNRPSEEQKLSLQIQQMDQVHIKDETAVLIGRLARLATDTEGTATGERPKAAARRVKEGRILVSLDSAAEELKNLKLIIAANDHQRRARNEMREIARLLLLSKDLADLLRAAIRETEAAIIFQKQIIEETAKAGKREEAVAVEDRQAELVDNTDLIRRDLDEVAPMALGHLTTAMDHMQEAREFLTKEDNADKRRQSATQKERDAVTSLEQAKRALQDQLARVEAEADKPENALAQLKELQKEVKELIDKQDKLKGETAQVRKNEELRTKAPQQGDLRDQTQDAQQKAATESPAAADALSDAARQMEKAQKTLAQSKSPQETQQAALDSLKKADAALEREIARLEDVGKQLAALDQLADKVGDLIKDQQQINADTAKEAAKPQPSSQQSKSLAKKEAAAGQKTTAAQKDAEQPAPAAAAHLSEASSQMNQAKAQLDKPDPKAASPAQAKALSELFAAKKEIESKASELRKELGLPQNSDPSLASAMAAIEKAQNEVNQAMSQMQNAPPGLMDSLQKQQQQIASALGDMARQDASPKVDQARRAASKAADQLSQGDLQNAIGSMQQAEQALSAAQQGEKSQPNGQKQSGQPPSPAEQGQKSQSGQPQGQQTGQDAQQGQSASAKPNGQTGQPQPGEEQDSPSIPQLTRQQTGVKQQAEALLAAQKSAPSSALDKAGQQLSQAAQDVTPAAAGDMGELPAPAQAALEQALNALNKAAAQASAHQQSPARQNSAEAAQALSQAQAALALADAGMTPETAQADPSQQGDQQGQGQQGQRSAQGKASQKGKGHQPGQAQGEQASNQPGQPGNKPGQPKPGQPSERGTGDVGNWRGTGGANGEHRNTVGPGEFTGLPKRDRAAIHQSQGDKYPQEYGPMVEQYLRNLSEDSGRK